MSSPEILLQKRQAQRESLVDLDGVRKVRIRRPLETELLRLQRLDMIDAALQCVVGWEGFTEADVLQSGGEDEVPFHPALFRDVVCDRFDWIAKIDKAIGDAANAYAEKRKAQQGNSLPIST